jgi:hypothetical protein
MPRTQARLKSEHKRQHPELDGDTWYDVVPIFPGVTQRMVNFAGQRLTRLATPSGYLILPNDRFEFRERPASGAAGAAATAGAR